MGRPYTLPITNTNTADPEYQSAQSRLGVMIGTALPLNVPDFSVPRTRIQVPSANLRCFLSNHRHANRKGIGHTAAHRKTCHHELIGLHRRLAINEAHDIDLLTIKGSGIGGIREFAQPFQDVAFQRRLHIRLHGAATDRIQADAACDRAARPKAAREPARQAAPESLGQTTNSIESADGQCQMLSGGASARGSTRPDQSAAQHSRASASQTAN